MRTSNIIANEIVELNEIRLAYNHYLASYDSISNVENATSIKHNKAQINNSLTVLHKELNAVKAVKQYTIPKQKTIKYQYSEIETSAILHFNADERFIITE